MSTLPLTARDRAILRAIVAGQAELVYGCEHDLLIDGRCCCDQVAAHRLVRAELIAPHRAAAVGEHVPAFLTAAGAAHVAQEPTGGKADARRDPGTA